MPPEPGPEQAPQGRVLLLTSLAMLAFAGNSVLCRMALADAAIDPASFTVVRMVAATLTLLLLVALTRGAAGGNDSAGGWRSALALIGYAAFFSYAYVSLDTATGALILFGTVQCTMIVAALLAGERPTPGEIAGWLLAVTGFCLLLLPGAASPSFYGAALMTVAGVGWGLYSLWGRGEARPLLATSGNFLRGLLPLLLLVLPVAIVQLDVTGEGLLIAVVAGSLTTGGGYILWYAALPSLTSLQAALVQLSVPAIAAVGGLLLLGEVPGLRVAASGALVLGGIWLATAQHARRRTG